MNFARYVKTDTLTYPRRTLHASSNNAHVLTDKLRSTLRVPRTVRKTVFHGPSVTVAFNATHVFKDTIKKETTVL